MKKRIVLAFCLLLILPCLLLLASCDGENGAETTEDASGTTGAQTTAIADTTRTYVVTFVVKGTAYKVNAELGEIPVCPVDPLEEEDVANKFFGWDKEIVAVTEDTTYTAWFGSAATITPAKDGAKAALTMTYDDGDYNTAAWVNQKNKQYGLKGSCMIIAGRDSFKSRVNDWRTIFAAGTLDPQCHSMSHTKDTIEGTQALYQNEVVNSKTALDGYFPKNDILCYATPYCAVRNFSYKTDANGNVVYKNGSPVQVNDGGSNALIQKTYFANRNGATGLQSLDPTIDDQNGGWYSLMVQWFYTNTSQTSAQRLAWIDDAVKNRGWLIILAHQIVDSADPNNSGDLYKLSKSNAEAFFKHASPYIQSGELWAATFGEATKYIRERQNATAFRRMDNGVLYVGLKIDRTTADGHYMDEDVFNYPLTVKSRVPDAWNSVKYKLNGKDVTANVFTDPEDNRKYVLVNVVPGADGLVTAVAVNRVD